MAINVFTEELLSLRDAARLLPARRRGKRPSLSCMYRWCKVGCRGAVLESVNVGGTRCTSRQALGRFIQSLNATSAVPGTPTPGAHERHLASVERQLDEHRIGLTGPHAEKRPDVPQGDEPPRA
jgi:hypothetical protein